MTGELMTAAGAVVKDRTMRIAVFVARRCPWD
jgi:hypothetical protein